MILRVIIGPSGGEERGSDRFCPRVAASAALLLRVMGTSRDDLRKQIQDRLLALREVDPRGFSLAMRKLRQIHEQSSLRSLITNKSR